MQVSKWIVTGLFLFIASLAGGLGCGNDQVADKITCSVDDACPLGQVCLASGVCDAVPCTFCEDNPDQVCYRATPEDEGTCSRPECATDDQCSDGKTCVRGLCSDNACVNDSDCGEGEMCNLAGECVEHDGTCEGDADCPDGDVCKEGQCTPGCTDHSECDEGEYCNPEEKTCLDGCRDSMECPLGQICTDGACACNADSCPDGKVCLETGNCGDPTSCDQLDCGEQVCDPKTLTCIDACTSESCQPNEICNAETGLCEVNNCPAEDPNQCDPDSDRPLWDPIKCFCAECVSNDDCDTAAGETCNAGGSCFVCETACDPNQPGTCGGSTPYCINDCCVQCVGAADCPQGQLCLDGFCGEPPNCQVDPSVCPNGYSCINGQCEPPQSGTCDPNDPTSCPEGTFCDPSTQMCSGAGGQLGCGMCNPDCTCPNGLTCDGFLCTGCTPFAGQCPEGQVCAPLEIFDPNSENVCFPNPF